MLFTHFSLVCYGMLLCYFWLLYHHYIIVSSLYHHCIIIGLQPADSRKDSLKKGGRLTCVNNKYRLFFGGGFTPGRLQYIPIAIQLYHHTTTGVYIFSRQLWRQPYCTGGVGVLVHRQGWTLCQTNAQIYAERMSQIEILDIVVGKAMTRGWSRCQFIQLLRGYHKP